MPEIREAITAPDGNIYSLWHALPEAGDKDSNANPYKLWIYLPVARGQRDGYAGNGG